MIQISRLLGYGILALLYIVSAHATTFTLPTNGDDIVGKVITVKAKSGDTLTKIGTRYNIGIHEMQQANKHIGNPYRLRVGDEVVVPQQFILPKYRKGIVLNIAELRLYYFPPGQNIVITHPVAMGKEAWRTPTGSTRVVRKEEKPIWHVPESIRDYTLMRTGKLLPERVMPGPDNPLGSYAMYLGFRGYLIHGNNAPWSVGRLVSSGCIRMHNDAIKSLYGMVDIDTPVTIVHHMNKAGWSNGDLYLESHARVSLDEDYTKMNVNPFDVAIYQSLNGRSANIDWISAEDIAYQQTGIPARIQKSTD